MTSQEVKRKLAAILSADVKGYSRLMSEDAEATVRTITAYKKVMNTLIQRYHGRVVDAPGDNLLAEFPSVVDAVACAVEIQKELKALNAGLPENHRMEFRIGITLGDVIEQEERIFGDGVNIAARLEGLSEAGGICISGTAYDHIRNKLPLDYTYLGEKTVKNIPEPVRVYRVNAECGPSGPEGETDTSEAPSIAVLPFANMSGDPTQEYFSDGITEEIITGLSKVPRLLVIARNSTFVYKGKPVKVQEVGRELGVRYVLEGSVQRAGGRVRITAQLIDAGTGHHLWAERYDRDMEDIFLLQDDVTEKIVSILRVRVEKAEIERVLKKPTESLKAYDYALRGRAYQYAMAEEQIARAREMYTLAVELDPGFAGAYVGLGWTYLQAWVNLWNRDPQSLVTAAELAQKALTLDHSLPSAYLLLGEVYSWKKEYEQAIGAIETAISLDPNNAENHATLSTALIWVGRPEEALARMEKAMRLNPYYPAFYLFGLSLAQFLLQKHEEAIVSLKKVLTRVPHFLWAHVVLALAFAQADRLEEARAEVSEVLRINPGFSPEALREMIPLRDQAFLEKMTAVLYRAGLAK